MQPLIGIIMGSKSDWETMTHAAETLEKLGVPFEVRVVSAHRTPDLLFEYAGTAESRGLEVIVAGAGGAAHLPGMTAAKTALPVLGVPIQSKALNGIDSLLSIAQMPAGIPVGTLAIGRAGAINAALLATAILGGKHPEHRAALAAFRAKQTSDVLAHPDPRTASPLRSAQIGPPKGKSVTVGVLGGGQLGKMLALAGTPLGERFVFLDPTAESPAGHVSDLVVGAYDDRAALEELAARCEIVTYEFESVPAAAVRTLEELGVAVFPPRGALEVAQDRFHEKSFFERLGIPTAPFARVDTKDDLLQAVARIGLPAVLKTRRFGYDGKGQAVLRAESDVDAAWKAVREAPCIVEGFVSFDRELSILAVRGRDGSSATYALTENHHQGGILRVSYAPAPNVPAAMHAKAAAYAERVVSELAYIGVLAVELFAVGDELVANEMAPRVHNSGHWTIEGAETSQFENHLRAILDLPLGDTSCVGASAMVNVIGAAPDRAALLAIEGAHVHLYGKDAAPGRKLGHVTVRDESRAVVLAKADRVRKIVG